MIQVKILGANCCEIQTEKGTFLQSYNTIVAAWIKGHAYKTSTKLSRTTSKHINQWLGKEQTVEEKPQDFFNTL